MRRSRVGWLVGLGALLGMLGGPTPGFAQFNCDIGSPAGDCTVTTVQAVTGDTAVVGHLTVSSTGALNYGNGTASITVGGDLAVSLSGEHHRQRRQHPDRRQPPTHSGELRPRIFWAAA